MRLLSIGNSFSTDSHRWLAQCAASAGEYVFAANLFIPGCPLKKHWELAESNEPSYRFEINGESLRWATINDALSNGKWDVITLQQVSGHSGMFETFEPYLSNLYALIREKQPDAKVYVHKTWAYETDCTLEGFANYEHSQKKMYDALSEAYQKAAETIDAEIIPTGDVIQYLREHIKEFDYQNGGLSLNRDGFHLSWLYGRYTAALVWIDTLLDIDIRKVRFVPEEFGTRADDELLSLIRNTVYSVLHEEG